MRAIAGTHPRGADDRETIALPPCMDGAANGTETHPYDANRRPASGGRNAVSAQVGSRDAAARASKTHAFDPHAAAGAVVMIALVATGIGVAMLLSLFSGIRERATQRR